jgi:hypothetical protein
MPKTAVGLFENTAAVEDVVSEIEHLGFPRQEVRTLEEPEEFEVAGVMSFPRLDFEVELRRELARIGATEAEAQVFLDGLRAGGALVLATGLGQQVDAAAAAMNRRGAKGVEESSGPEPDLPDAASERAAPIRNSRVLTGRVLQPGGGASIFAW